MQSHTSSISEASYQGVIHPKSQHAFICTSE